jgi:hypothetical protein
MLTRTSGATVALLTLLGAGPAVADAPVRLAGAALPGDFDGDGYRDLAVGALNAAVGGVTQAGAVAVTYGSAGGANLARHTVLSQSSAGIPGIVEKGDRFGSSLAVGDFDGDGYSDLIIGASGEDVGTVKDAGSLTIVFGSAQGLAARAIAIGNVGAASLAAGDFDHDGRTDVATAASDGPKIWVVRGTTSTTPKAVAVSPGVDGFVDRLTAGDVTGDGYADLAVSWWWDDPADEGSTSVFAGSAKGLGAKVGPTIELGDTSSLAVGDLDHDGRAEVVIGGYSDTETYHIYPGTPGGMDQAHGTTGDEGGSPVSVGDINGDGYADLASHLSDDEQNQSVVKVRLGGADGLTSTVWSVKENDVHLTPDENNMFGNNLTTTDLNGDGRADLVIGASGWSRSTGAVALVPGGASGFDLTGARLVTSADLGVGGTGGFFGAVLP